MTQSQTQIPTTSFNKGLITERSELTFPEGYTTDELNCTLERDGSRKKRLGIDFEADYVLSQEEFFSTEIYTTSDWKNVGGDSSVEFCVVQSGARVVFYEKTVEGALSQNYVPTSFSNAAQYVIYLAPYEHLNSSNARNAPISTASINGGLVICSPEMDAIFVTRDLVSGAFTVERIEFLVRDFKWMGDVSEYTEEINEGQQSQERRYDALNSGWTANLLSNFANNTTPSQQPSLTLSWFAAKDLDDNFSVEEWEKIDKGTSRVANGRFIYDLFLIGRGAIVANVENDVERSRFRAVSAFQGRMFYSGLETGENATRVYFSQLIQDDQELGWCYQVNDPTSEILSDLLDTDGGYINIPDAYNIKLLHSWGDTLYVFAANGVWGIKGIDGVFKATEYSVQKITEVGIDYPGSFVSAEGRPYWWSTVGIHTIVTDGIQVTEQNLTISSIQTYWNSIDANSLFTVQGVFDKADKKIFWMYNNDTNPIVRYKYNKFLILDETLGAFYPWEVSDVNSTTSPHIVGATFFDKKSSNYQSGDVVLDNGDNVTQGDLNNQVVSTVFAQALPFQVKFLTLSTFSTRLTWSSFYSESYQDWARSPYFSYLETGYIFMGDMTLKKNAPYIITYAKDDDDQESALNLTGYWDFREGQSSAAQQIYRRVAKPEDTDIITTRLKIRGRGRSLRLRFTGSTEDKPFHLIGWSIIGGVNRRY